MGKLTFKGGFNVLCYAMAGYFVVEAIVKYDNWKKRSERDKALQEACKAVKTIDELFDKINVKNSETEETN